MCENAFPHNLKVSGARQNLQTGPAHSYIARERAAERRVRIGGDVKWLSCGTEFIVADVIRWREPIWKPQPRSSKKKPTMIGQRAVTGQVLKIDRNGWAHIQVAACTVEQSPRSWHPVHPLKVGETIRRRRSKIGQGKVDRLLWSDETARAAIVGSRFVKT